MTAVVDRPAAAPETPAPAHRIRRLPRLPRLPRAPRQRSTAGVAIGWTAGVLALVLGWFVVYAVAISAVQESHSQQVLYSKFRQQLAEETAPIGGQIQPGAPVALLSFPRIGMKKAIVVEGTASGDLEKGPGHSRSTVLPGQLGTSVLYGRATLFGGPFGAITSAEPGDTITVLTGQGKSVFRVTDVRHAGDPYPPALPANGARLTLATAEGSGWRSGWADSSAVYVDATLQGKAYQVPPDRTLVVPKSERAMQGDPSALYSLVLWLPLLALSLGVVVWAQDRWGRLQTWLVGLPIVLACLWGVSATAVRLLPNLL